jgi:hypothetical protein
VAGGNQPGMHHVWFVADAGCSVWRRRGNQLFRPLFVGFPLSRSWDMLRGGATGWQLTWKGQTTREDSRVALQLGACMERWLTPRWSLPARTRYQGHATRDSIFDPRQPVQLLLLQTDGFPAFAPTAAAAWEKAPGAGRVPRTVPLAQRQRPGVGAAKQTAHQPTSIWT